MNNITIDTIRTYVNKLEQKGYSSDVISRKLHTTLEMLRWAYHNDFLKYSQFQQMKDEIANFKARFEASDLQEANPVAEDLTALENSKNKSLFDKISRRLPFYGSRKTAHDENIKPTPQSNVGFQLNPQYYVGLAFVLLIMAILGAGIYERFFKATGGIFAYPSSPSAASRILSFQGRLTDSLGNPITTATNMRFRLYTASSGGTTLYDTGTCSITPDQDGVHNVLIGSDCGSEVASSVFTENTQVWLGVLVGSDSEMTPRQRMANVPYAMNAETLQGLPVGTEVSTIPYINAGGDLLMAAASPQIGSTYTNQDFLISSARAITIQSAGAGDVTLTATESGTIKFATGGSQHGLITNTGLFGFGTTGPDAKLDVLYTGGEQLRLTYADGSTYTGFTTNSGGDLTIDPSGDDVTIGGDLILADTFTVQVGGKTATAYNAFANSGDAPESGSISSDNDVYIGGDLEVDGSIVGTVSPGFTQGSVVFTDGSGNLAQDNASFFFDDTNNLLGIGTASPVGKLHVTGAVTGKALSIFNETGDQNIITASASGTTVANLDRSGNLAIEGAISDLGGSTLAVNDNLDVSGTLFSGTGDAFQVDASGNITAVGGTFSGDIAVNGGDITSSASTFNLTIANAGSVNFTDGSNTLVAIKDQGVYPFLNLAGKTDTGDPGTCAEGDIYYNDTDDTLKVCHESNTWEALDGGAVASQWTDGGTTVYLTDTTDEVVIGGSSPLSSSKFSIDGDADQIQLIVQGNGTQTTNLATFEQSDGTDVFTITNAGNLTAAGDLAVNGDDITSDSNLTLNATGYTRIGDTASPGSANGDDDLFVEGDLEIDGVFYLDGTLDTTFTAGSVVFAGASGVLAQDNASFFFDDTNNLFGIGTASPVGKLHVTGAVTGKALSIFNETGDQDIIAASSSGTTRFRVGNDGTVYGGYFADMSNNAYGIDPAGTSNFGGYSLKVTGGALLAADAGNVGIGDQTPDAKLNILATTEQLRLDYDDSNYTSFTVSSGGDLTLAPTGSDTNVTGNLAVSGGTTLGDASGDTVTSNAAAWTFANDTTVALSGGVNGINFDSDTLSIDATNNRVGIGTAAPAAPLEVVGNTRVNTGVLQLYHAGTNPSIAFGNAGGASLANIEWNAASSEFRIGNTWAGGASSVNAFYADGSEKMRLTGTGLLGIGDTTPDAFLDITGTTSQLRLSYETGDTNYASFTLSSGGDLTVAPTGGDLALTGDVDISDQFAAGPNGAITANTIGHIAYSTVPVDTTGTYGIYLAQTTTGSGSSSQGHTGIYNYLADNSSSTGNLSMIATQSDLYMQNGSVGGNSSWRNVYGFLKNEASGGTHNGSLYNFYASALNAGTKVWSSEFNYYSLLTNSGAVTTSNLYNYYAAAPVNASGTITTAYGMRIEDQSVGTNTTAYGVYIAAQAGASGDAVGLYIADADDYSIQLASTDGDAASGITFGTDTNLYRNSTNQLHTDDSFDIDGNLIVDGNTTIGNASGDTVTSNADAWTFANDTTVALSGGLNGINFDSNTLSIDGANDRVGIGTAAPASPLEISVSSNNVISNFNIANTAASGNDKFAIDTYGDSTGLAASLATNLYWNNGSDARFSGSHSAWRLWLDNRSGADFTKLHYMTTGGTLYTPVTVTGGTYDNALFIGSTGNVGFGSSGPDAKVDSLATSGEQLRLTYTDGSAYTGFTVGSGGDLTLDTTGGDVIFSDADVINIGGNGSDVAYNAIGDSTAGASTVDSDDDLYIEGNLEVDGTATVADLSCTDCLDFAEFEDTLDLDAALVLNQGTNVWTQNFTGTTTVGYTFAADSVTSGTGIELSADALAGGKGLYVSSTSTALTTGNLALVDWSPGSATTATGDLFKINIGTNGNVGNILNVTDTSSSLFRVAENQIESAIPHSFTAAGDVSIAYDLLFTNQTAAYIKSSGPFTVESGETFESNDLTLKTYNSGNILLDAGGSTTNTGTVSFYDSNIKGATVTTAIPFSNASADINTFRTNFTDETIIDALNEVYSAAGLWTDGGTTSYLTATTDELVLGGTSALSSSKFSIDGDADQTQLIVQGNGTQTTDLVIFETSAGSDVFNLTNAGNLDAAGTLTSGTANAFSVDASGNITTAGDLAVNGDDISSDADLTITPAGGDVLIAGHVSPTADDTYDLGTNTARWRDIYLGPDTLHVGTSTSDEGTMKYVTSTNVLTFTNNFGDTDFGSTSDGFNFTLGGGAGDDFIVDTTTLVVESDNNRVGIGTAAPDSALHVLDTGDQFRFGYDASNYIKGNISSSGDLTLVATGSDIATESRLILGSASAGTSQLTVTGAAVGKALTVLNETGNQNVLVASISGTQAFAVTNNGDVVQGKNGGISGLADNQSLAPNPSFEIDADGVYPPDGWADSVGTNTTTSTSNHGNTAILLDTDTDAITSHCFPVAGGKTLAQGIGTDRTYSVSLWSRLVNVTTSNGLNAGIYTYANRTECVNNTTPTTLTAIANGTPTQIYGYASGTVAPTVGETWARGFILYDYTNNNNDIYVDGFSVTQTNVTSGLDLAETYPAAVEENIQIGEIVSFGTESKQSDADVNNITRSRGSYDSKAFGVVATQPGYVLDDNKNTYNKVKVALKGRVPVLVTTENGPIKVGDPITASSKPGIGMKATRSGRIVGYAMSEWTSSNPQEIDQVTVFVNPETYVDLSVLTQLQESVAKLPSMTASALTQADKILINTAEAVLVKTETLIASTIKATNATIDNLIVDRIVSREITSKTVRTEALEAEKVTADNIVAQNIEAKDATFSGKLVAQEIDADNIRELRDRLERLSEEQDSEPTFDSAGLQEEVENIQNYLENLPDQESTPGLPINEIATNTTIDPGTTTSITGEQIGMMNLENLTVTGTAAMTSLAVADSFTAGNIFMKDNSVLSLSNELKLSALEQVNIMDGAVIIAKNGTITAKGEVIAEKGVRTNTIKPLDQDSTVGLQLSQNKVEVLNNNSVVAAINNDGSAKFKDVSVDTYTEATSSAAIIAAEDNYDENGILSPGIQTNAAAAGNGLIPAKNDTIVIFNDTIGPKSLVYVTATSKTFNQNLYVAQKKSCTPEEKLEDNCKPYFTVHIDGVVKDAITFNWWIVN